MEASITSNVIGVTTLKPLAPHGPAMKWYKSHVHYRCVNGANRLIGSHRLETRVSSVVTDVVPAVAVDPVQAEITWQIIVGALAGVIPFIVTGIEFRKRIIAQQKCTVCGGSGLVFRDKKYYFRCPGCGKIFKLGGFLPWQSWKRFFSG